MFCRNGEFWWIVTLLIDFCTSLVDVSKWKYFYISYEKSSQKTLFVLGNWIEFHSEFPFLYLHAKLIKYYTLLLQIKIDRRKLEGTQRIDDIFLIHLTVFIFKENESTKIVFLTDFIEFSHFRKLKKKFRNIDTHNYHIIKIKIFSTYFR